MRSAPNSGHNWRYPAPIGGKLFHRHPESEGRASYEQTTFSAEKTTKLANSLNLLVLWGGGFRVEGIWNAQYRNYSSPRKQPSPAASPAQTAPRQSLRP